MISITKYVVLLIVIGCSVPVWADSGKVYINEKVYLQTGGQPIHAIARHTLVDGHNTVRYSIRNLFDHNVRTAWVTKLEQSDEDVGTFEIDFDKPVYVQSITFQNGYQKNPVIFSDNQRVKDLIVYKILTKDTMPIEADLTLKDTMAPQRISARNLWGTAFHLFKTRKLVFIIDSVYPGTRYTDLCLSEITINYANRIDYIPTQPWKMVRSLIEQNKTKTFHGGWDWSGFDNTEKYPEAFNDFLYYVVTGNKDAYALFQSFDPEDVSSSEDMNNFFRKAVKESLSADELKK